MKKPVLDDQPEHGQPLATRRLPGSGCSSLTRRGQGTVECHSEVLSFSKPSRKGMFDSEMSS